MNHEPSHVWLTDTTELNDAELVIVARSMIAARKALHDTLPSELIPDPALDILVGLFIAFHCNETLTFADILSRYLLKCQAVRRWVNVLTQYGFVSEHNEACRLTTLGVSRMRKTLANVAMSQWQFAE